MKGKSTPCDTNNLSELGGPLALHGTEFIERIEQLGSRDPIFRKLLGAVWQNNIPDDIWRRLKAVAGPSL